MYSIKLAIGPNFGSEKTSENASTDTISKITLLTLGGLMRENLKIRKTISPLRTAFLGISNGAQACVGA
jgi:hypothetical protein